MYKIGSSAFEWAKAKEIILPDTVACIEDSAFGDTEKLQELYMPKLREIGECAFAGNGIKEIKLPENMKVIPASMCMGMESLVKVEIPEGLLIRFMRMDYIWVNNHASAENCVK